MRNAWLKTFATLVLFGAFTATNAQADPSSMAMYSHQPQPESSSSWWPWSKKTTPAPVAPAPVAPPVDRPTDHISATKHPIQYMKAAVSEMPIGHKKGPATTNPTMAAAGQASGSTNAWVTTPAGPPTPQLFIYASQVCEQQHDIEQARVNLKRAMSMWPENTEVLRSAALLEDRQGNLPVAESLYQRAVRVSPQDAGTHNDLGLCLARQGKLEPSVQELEQAVQLQPTKPLYRNNVATVLVEMHQDQRALAHLAAVHGSADANYNLGQLLVLRNRPNDAAQYFQAALQQNPGMKQAQDALAKLQPQQAATAVAQAPGVTAPGAMQMAPQQGPIAPQYSYPATAQAPTANMSGAVTPQYLPPVARRPGNIVR